MNNIERQKLKEDICRRIKEKMCHRISDRLCEAEDYDMTANDTHFAIYKPQNKIIFSWNYSDVDPVDLRNRREEYFTADIRDNGIDPKDVKVMSRNMVVRMGLDPTNQENWTNGVNEQMTENAENYSEVASEWVYNKWHELLNKFSHNMDELITLFDEYLTVRQKEELIKRFVEEGYLDDSRF